MLTQNQNRQIKKFGFYGLLKNLRFFDPFILIYFISYEMSLFHIGLLFSIKEIIIYIFEIPSGVIADRLGKKRELYLCFVFYIASFVVFFFATEFLMFVLAMSLFGLGEAFRSGTHKAMIMSYLDQEQIETSKVKVYGLTRSYSLIGSMIASIASIFLVFYFVEIKYLFLVAIIPYTIDLLLIMSYPASLDERKDTSFSISSLFKQTIVSMGLMFQSKALFFTLLNSSSYQATFKMIKDYIQPILLSVTVMIVLSSNLSLEENQTIYLGLLYAVIYLLSAIASRNAYHLKKVGHTTAIIHGVGLVVGLLLVGLSFYLDHLLIVGSVFLLLYILTNLRKPVMVERLGEVSHKDQRATILSIESQLTSLFVVVFAPMLGYLADFNLSLMFAVLGLVMLLFYGFSFLRFLLNPKK